jgi:TonB family protein
MATANDFQLGILPERKLSWKTLATSYGFEVLLVIAIINVGLIWPERLHLTQNYHITELVPLPPLQAPQPLQVKAPPLRAKLLPPAHLPVFSAPRLTVPREIRVARAQPAVIVPPKIMTNQFAAPVLRQVSGGARMAKLIRTGEFGSSATPTINAPIQKVQTGGFGDPNGVPGTGKSNAHLTIASTGSFDLPQGSGQGNGAGGANGIKGTVASAGFGNGIAQPGQGDGRSSGRSASVQTAGFGAQVTGPGLAKIRAVDNGPATTPVEIVSKLNPIYTQEARQLKLEGDVLLEVLFAANGQLHVNRVVRGLGHGLDESALAAASQMRFKPARRNGIPIDSTALVHVVFRLAY